MRSPKNSYGCRGGHWEGQTLTHEEYKKRLDFSFDYFPDKNFEITLAIEEEDDVAISWILRGTNSGMIGNLPPTNKEIEVNGITIYHFSSSARILAMTNMYRDKKII